MLRQLVRAMDSIPTKWERLILTSCGRCVGASTFTKLTADNSDDLELWLLENFDRLPRACRFNEHALPSDIPYLRLGVARLCRSDPVDAMLQRGSIAGIFKLVGATKLQSNLSKVAHIQSLLFMNVNSREHLLQVQPWGTQEAEGRARKRMRRRQTWQSPGKDDASDKECLHVEKSESEDVGARVSAASSCAIRAKPRKTIVK